MDIARQMPMRILYLLYSYGYKSFQPIPIRLIHYSSFGDKLNCSLFSTLSFFLVLSFLYWISFFFFLQAHIILYFFDASSTYKHNHIIYREYILSLIILLKIRLALYMWYVQWKLRKLWQLTKDIFVHILQAKQNELVSCIYMCVYMILWSSNTLILYFYFFRFHYLFLV